MKFAENMIEVDEILKLQRDEKVSFEVCVCEPVELREHLVEQNDGKYKMVDCLFNENKGDQCPYCITAKTLLGMGTIKTIEIAKKLYAKKRFMIPVELDDKRYIFRFGTQIHSAYNQLVTEAKKYNFDGSNLTFNHIVGEKHGFPDYGTCSFSFYYGKGKNKKIKTITIDTFIYDIRRFI
jgi:hypothetical protein